MSGKIQGVRNQSKRRSHAGFTLLELVAVIVVIVLLAALALPALAGSKGRTKIGQCASNLKQFGLAMQIYAADNSEKLPVQSGYAWAWDLPWDLGNSFELIGTKWPVMYCPGTEPQFDSRENFQLWTYVPGSYHVVGYALTLFGSGSLVIQSNQNATLAPQSIQLGSSLIPPTLPSQRVLLADATISSSGQDSPPQRYSTYYNYTANWGGYQKPHRSAHLVGKFPIGGNLAMLDGHVEWREFQEMLPRSQGNAPVFWW